MELEKMPKVYSININGNGGVPKYRVNQANIGKLRVEGKEYIVNDGDIMHFRFNV